MTINERVSDERIANLIEVLSFYSPEDKHLANNESELASALRELQQYRAAAEPARNPVLGYADSYRDMAKRGVESVPIWSVITDLERNIAPLFAAPQVTSVPEEATPESIEVLASVRPPHGVAFQLDGYERKLASDIWNACRGAMLTGEGETAAPPVQAEQLSVDTLANVLRNAPVAPSDNQGKKRGNSPAIPDGYALVPIRLTAENGAKELLSGEFSETKFISCPECFGDDECETCDGSGRIEITVPVSWTTIKEIWAKGVEHFAAAPKQDAE